MCSLAGQKEARRDSLSQPHICLVSQNYRANTLALTSIPAVPPYATLEGCLGKKKRTAGAKRKGRRQQKNNLLLVINDNDQEMLLFG